MKIISWNVNGIRAIVKKGFVKFLQTEKPDILCLQEIKISDSARNKEKFDFAGYQEFWNSARRPGYSGTMTLVKDGVKVLSEIKFPDDTEGRAQILEFSKFYLANIYFPNAQEGLKRIDFKLEFNDRLLKFLKKLEKKKPLIICGDFNVAHEPIDLARPKENEGSAGYSEPERKWLNKFFAQGFVDTFRCLNPKKIQYSWWSFRMNARARNVGWRIDYFCVSCQYMKYVKSSLIYEKILGSDHCPVGVEIK